MIRWSITVKQEDEKKQKEKTNPTQQTALETPIVLNESQRALLRFIIFTFSYPVNIPLPTAFLATMLVFDRSASLPRL